MLVSLHSPPSPQTCSFRPPEESLSGICGEYTRNAADTVRELSGAEATATCAGGFLGGGNE